jgi:hypothetical protein
LLIEKNPRLSGQDEAWGPSNDAARMIEQPRPMIKAEAKEKGQGKSSQANDQR